MKKQNQFSSVYTGKEFFLTDHMVMGEQVLPGVAYLEMARAAGEYVAQETITQIKEVNWLHPVKVKESPVELHISIQSIADEFTYEIYTTTAEKTLHGQGILSTSLQQAPAAKDITALRHSFTQSEEKAGVQDGAGFYEIFSSIGLDYGKTFQGIQQIYYNAKAALSSIVLPANAGFLWSPGMMDSALQTCMGISLLDGSQQLMLPFSVREINIYQPLPEEIWCYVTKNSAGKMASSYDIELLNEAGEVLISFTELVVLPLAIKNNADSTAGLNLYSQNWQTETISSRELEQSGTKEGTAPLVFIAGAAALLAQKLEERLECEVRMVSEGTPDAVFIQVLEELQQRKLAKSTVHFVYAVTDELDYSFISGMLKTIAQENPLFSGKMIGVESLAISELANLTGILLAEQGNAAAEVRYLDGQREIKVLNPVSASSKNTENYTNDELQDTLTAGNISKENGVYLITGGAGGLGLIFAAYLNKVAGTKVILAGRSVLSTAQQEHLKELPHTVYERCDVTQLEEVKALVEKIKAENGHLDGIIHSAGLTRDSLLMNKTAIEVEAVFSAKVKGAKNLDEATQQEQLDFMVYCSSLAGVFGNTGQSDYAAANAWLDNYAHYRELERIQGKRTGKTLSINWPLWKEGGMQIDQAQEKYMANHFGLLPMPAADGLAAFESLLNSNESQGVVLYGNPDKLNALLTPPSALQRKKAAVGKAAAVNEEVLYAASLTYLRSLLTKELRMKEQKLDAETPFEQYGIDSIMITKLTNCLEAVFERIPRTLFFECQTLAELTEYFVEVYPDKLIQLTGLKVSYSDLSPVSVEAIDEINNQTSATAAVFNAHVISQNKTALQPKEISKTAVAKSAIPVAKEPIAIIGLGGRYPGAKTIADFWENLKAGKDSITEIPADRWDLTDFYDKEKGKAGKSYSKWGGFLEDMDHFDPLFFNISVREAELMDPQARLFLQTAWETLEDAGYTKTKLQGEKGKNSLGAQVGVYVGVMYEEYPLFGAEENAKGNFVNPGGSISSIANRVSYFFNLHGPSMAIDTMCSSSLTAIHLACESIQNGSCTMALAGGVNLSVHPNKYLMLSQGMFVSSEGRCESFGEGGEGYVPGEGVGAVLLKSLSQALADGDRIYGLIKGTSLNHGGKTNGYTVPNPKAQAAVIKAAMKKAGVKAEDFSYIEAHGTGTSLGDPIEIAGLAKAFDSKNKQFCSIGSVKSNIGHCESAAGISGLTKVLLQLKYRQLVPSLHSAKLNPNIDFENTPFKVQQELEKWPALNNKPRIAGISGFGAGGSNAHLIIEEYVPLTTTAYTQVIPPVIVLSAKDTDRLKELVANLKSYVEAQPELNLDDLAYTLQTGREAMEERLAFIAEDREDLIALLNDYQNQKIQELYIGNTRKDHPGISLEGKSGKAYLESAIREKESHSLAQLWAKGVNIDWNLLYTAVKPSLIGLPAYPFSSERYWFPQGEGELSVNRGAKLHPLLHSNSSSLQEQQFTSVYTGKESFLMHHQVQQVKILPGVAYLELARAAAEQSVQDKVTQLKEITWFSPVKVEAIPQTVFTSLFSGADQQIEYEIYTDNGTEEFLHCKGLLTTKELDRPEKQDLEKIKSALTQEISGEACYGLFSEAGIEYGSSFRGIKALYYNEDAVLSRISLPQDQAYVLNPGLLDSALQTCIGMQLGKSSKEILLPFSVTELNIYQALSEEVWCSAKKNRAGSRVSSYDVDLLDAEGQVLISFKELVLLPLNGFTKLGTTVNAGTAVNPETTSNAGITVTTTTGVYAATAANAPTQLPVVAAESETSQKPVLQKVNGLHLFADNWKPDVQPFVSLTAVTPLIILAGGTEAMAAGLQENLSLVVKASNHINEEDFFNEVLAIAKVLMPHKNPAHLVIVCSLDNYRQYGFITGLLKTLTQENPKITGKLISVEEPVFQHIEELTNVIAAEQQTIDQEIRYRAGLREVRTMESVLAKTSDTANIQIKTGGVYLITGGAGGLGLIFAQYISKTKGVKLILTGRSESLSPAQQKAVGRLGATYYHCDVSDAVAVNELVKNILAEHKKLDGIIHSAGVIRDSLIVYKTTAEVKQVFAAKIKGTRNLDLATKDLALDFMVSCSSIAGVNGNAGQSDYAAANAWVDNYAYYRENERLQGRRQGKTLSINWPLWKDGGMQLDAESETYMELHFGLIPMPTTAGLEAFEDLMNSEIVQGMVLYGQTTQQSILADQLIESAESLLNESMKTLDVVPVTAAVTNEILNDAAIKYLRKLLAKELRMPEEKLLAEVPFENYGIDSVLVIRLSNRLEEVFGKLPRTLFFEYLSLKELCGYFLEAHRSQVLDLTGLAVVSAPVTSVVQQEATMAGTPFVNQNRRQRFAGVTQQQQQQQQNNLTEAIAIIGISGRYPGANNLSEFWENLKAGKDCITEVPEDRWNAEEMYHEEKGQPGKSYSKWGGFMNDIDKFDPLFFNISPREAELMDPQERLFLQTVWETMEDAGYTRESLRAEDMQSGIARRIGVYAGVMYEEYQLFGAEERMKGNFVTPAGIASSIANRVSYFFNFNGPSMAVDTMCSSSLTAIHLACKDILTGDTDMAIAGGVNVSVHPNKYLMLSQGRFVSGAGRCESFGEGGDGYVPGEGVGTVLLKRLSEAIKDGDHIYGLIKGTALNHGGKTNGYTVPNPKAQAAVIKAAMKKAGVKAGDFSYVEAHGTGTSLGDPIEIAGLNRAFETTDKQFCSIGSVKSNIGHCESAAGISGLTKVILQLQHQQFVPSLHSAALNPEIDFVNSPFKVQQALEEWPSIAGKARIAGISGFGAGGSNAHVIIQEYQRSPVQTYAYQMPAIIVLSAKQASRILIQVSNLKSFLEAHPQTNLYDLAYTLQIGREAMDERLAFIADSIEDLLVQLTQYHQGETANSIAGNIRKEEAAVEGNDARTIAQAWVRGMATDWNLLYQQGLPLRISLPAYPFVKDRYWIPVLNKEIIQNGTVNLHPLLHSNESDLGAQKFTSTYTGKEDFLIKCHIPNYKELPATALLELAREAGERSLRQNITQIKDVTWMDPIRVNGSPAKVQINLFAAGKDIGYEIYTHHQEQKEKLSGQGLLNATPQQVPDKKDIQALLKRYQQEITKDEFYQLFADAGKNHALDFQGIVKLYCNETQALSKIELPVTDGFILSPGLLDSAVQTCTGWLLSKGERLLYQLSGVAEVTIFGTLPAVIWCHAVFERQAKGAICCQLEVLNAQGDVLLHFKDLILIPEQHSENGLKVNSSMAYKPVWDRIIASTTASAPILGKQVIVLGNSNPVFAQGLSEWLTMQGAEVSIVEKLEAIPDALAGVYLLQGLPGSPEESQQELAVFMSVKQLLNAAVKDLKLTVFTCQTQQVFADDLVKAAGSGITGLIGALVKEQPQWSVNRIDLQLSADLLMPVEPDWSTLLAMSLNQENAVTCLRGGHYYKQQLYPLVLPEIRSSKFRKSGVYILLGGAGGLGIVTTEYLVKHYQAQVIWLGRRPADAVIQAAQEKISLLGMKPEYYQCDAANLTDVEKTYQSIKETHQEIHGLFHSAIVLQDRLLKNMTEADFNKAFIPKSVASQNLVQVFGQGPLDFICFYSSVQALVHAPGQGNYAAGCAYKDSYALSVNSQHIPVKIINWGFWGEVGVVAADGYKDKMKQAGVESITAEEGMQLLEMVIGSDQQQVVAIKLSNTAAAAIPAMRQDLEISAVKALSVLQLAKPDELVYPKADQLDLVFKKLCCKGLLQVLLESGLMQQQQAGQTLSSLRTVLAIQDKYEQLFFVLIGLLQEQNYLTVNESQITIDPVIQSEISNFSFEQQMNALVEQEQEYRPHGTLLQICLAAFQDILTGKQQATTVMFPGGSMAYVSGIYKGNAQSDYFNNLLASIVKNSVAQSIPYLQPGEKIRILEVGAGTGGTSQVVFKALEPYKEHLFYLYTDLSRTFLSHAEQHFKGIAPYLETAILNIEQDPDQQQVALGSYDIVIGANVVHATKNMAVTLNNIKALLKKNGLFILNEIARTELFTTLTFGLLDGWWLYEDAGIRLKGSPGLSAAGWKTVLTETGYSQVRSYPGIADLSQQIVCALSDGMVQHGVVQHGTVQHGLKINGIVPQSKQPLPMLQNGVIKPTASIIKENTSVITQTVPVMKKAMDNKTLVNKVVNIAAALIKLPPAEFDIESQFMDYGFDSILSMELVKNINETLNVALKPTDIFSYNNIQQLADFLQLNFGELLQTEFAEEIAAPFVALPQAVSPMKTRFSGSVVNAEPVYIAENDIAVIGMSGQFGAANDLDTFWDVLKNGQSLVGDLPESRWQGYVNKESFKWTGSFLLDIDKFDPVFFKISGNEAGLMDPQQRLFLEHCWKAIEDAAINPKSLKGSKCGVYAGVAPSDYSIRECEEASVMWGNSSAVLAARISYLLDLKGPAVSVDTACSSSLLAMDMGCSSLQKGETDLIIAGGVNIMTTPGFYSLADRAGMMSAGGQCYTFDKRADGFVPGEGVGVVIMKRLADAERDGDRIYGVIKASLTNQDGASNGITAPSVLAQQELEKEVYQKFKINPETISYVEAHGTGTSLGDPIELDALTHAFRKYTERKQYCTIGSVKTNIGHTLVAAGVAGVIKIMLSLKHKQLPPSLNYEECNPLIDMLNSPFKVEQKLLDWATEHNNPRRAAINSFGFSGTNVHMIIEEYQDNRPAVSVAGPAVIVISAKNAERLQNQVKNLVVWLERNPETLLSEIAYTLQKGRQPMEERLAIIASDRAELNKQLADFLNGNTDQLMTGNIKKNKADFLLEGGAGQAYIDYAVTHGEIKSIALLWTKGITISWDLLYTQGKPKRISLPVYAFARQRYWVPEAKNLVSQQYHSYLHPLLHRNTSTVKALQFTSVFTGKEQFLEDHQIQSKKILPGVAYLEMARTAGTEALGQGVTGLKNVAWLSPVSVTGQEEKVNIRLKDAGEELSYEIYSVAGQERLHSQGRILTAPLPAKDRLDLKAIRSRLTHTVERTVCYGIFKQMGLNYGTSFQGIETMYYTASEALSKISLPQENGFAVSPGLLDSALQTCMGLSFVGKKSSVQLPFSVKEILFYAEVPNTVWSYARKSKTNHGNGPVTIYDVDIVNEMGDVLLSFRDFVTLPVDGPGKTESTDAIVDTCIFNLNWEAAAAEENFAAQEHEVIPLILLAGGPAQLAENLKGELGIETETITGETAEEYLLNVMAVVKKKVAEKHNSHLLIVCSHADYLDYGFISGLLKTAHLENPGISGKLIVVDRLSVKDMPELSTILQAELSTADSEIRYEAGLRKVKKLQEIDLLDHDGLKIKEGGVYLILGGAGGVGSIFANHISKIPQTKVILAGRGELDARKKALIAGLAHGDYFNCDITNKEEVNRLLALVKEKYQRIDGIIHSAGITRDSLITNKTAQEVHQVLGAKITGVKNLDEAAKDEALDFMIFFSGLAGISGNAGQADYAAANVYLDNYAFYRESERVKGKRQGKTISINWPFWKDGGMSIDQASLEYLNKQYGLLPLPSVSGINVFDQLLASQYNQGIVVYGKVDKIRPQFLNKLVVKQKQLSTATVAIVEHPVGLQLKVAAKLLAITAQLLKLPESDLELDEKLSDYGFDSILLIKYSNELNDFYDTDLTPAVFYNYPTIDGLAEFLIEEYQEKLLVKHQPELVFTQEEEMPEEAFQEVVQKRYPLSEGQKGLWFIQQLEPENVNYNVPVSFIIPGVIEHELVKKAFQLTLDEYPILKSSFLTDELTGEVYNQFNTLSEVELDDQDLTEDQQIKEVCWKLIRTPFNLETGRPVKLYIRRDQKAAKNYVLLVFHHIIFDGMSSSVFIASLFEKYQALVSGQNVALKEPDFAYFNYVEWEQIYMQGKQGEKSLAYWKENLAGVLPILNLPYDLYVPGKLKTTTIGIERMQLEQQQVEQLKELSRALKVNLSVIFSGIYAMLLHKLTGEEDLLVLMPTAGRPRKEYENSIGYYVNMMILRNRVSGDLTFAELVKNIQQEMINGISHAAYPLPKLLADLNLDRSGSRETPFKVSFIYQNIFDELMSGGSGVEIYDEVYQETAHVYSLEIQDLRKDIIVSLKYDQDVFIAGTIKTHMGYFNELLKGVLEDAAKQLKIYEVLSPNEIHYLLNERNATTVAYPQNKTLSDLFEQQVLQTPDHIAVVHDGKRISYTELNQMANRLAALLVKSGLPANAPVAIVSHKSLEQVWGVLGILKAGGHYIPVKGSLPQARMNELISQTESSIVLVQRDYLDKVHCPEGVRLMVLEEDTFAAGPVEHETVKVLDTELAYIIFTSGSTGKPKGVMIDHRGAVNTLYDMNARFNITAEDKVFGISDLNFDLSVYDIFGTLACGATLILPLEKEGLNPDIWLRYVQEEKVTVWNSVPQIVNLLIERQEDTPEMQLSSLRMYWMSGDWIPLDLPGRIRALNPASEVISLGGATEGSIWSIYFPIGEVDPSWKSIPYGYPLGNQEMYVLDANLSPCPVNVPGDIYIGGIGVAKGYHNDPEKTAASFMLHPGMGKQLYRTGDMGCQHPDGFIMFLGRQDGQVKINGFRVELGEIETVLQLSPLVKQGIVLTVEDDCRNKRLVAYIVVHDTLNKEELQQHLRAHLPEYMVPSLFVEIDKIPLSSNGKVDRKALPDAEFSTVVQRDFIAPCDAMEIELAAIWSKLLKIEKVGIHDNFFDAGGNSLTMIQLTHKINTAFGKDIQLIHIMKSPTIAEIKVLIHEYEDAQDAAVLTLREGLAEEVAFIIPGALGSTEGYFGLAGHLPGEGAVYGLQMKGIAGNETPNTSIEAMAAYNLEQIKQTGVIGGITLLAHSYGGIVIYEMIKQAEGTGVEIEKVILLDCFVDPLSSFYNVEEADKLGTYFRSLIKFSQPWLDEKAVNSLVDQLPAENYMTFICEIVHTLPAKTIGKMWEVFRAAISAVYSMDEQLNQTVNFIQADNSKLEGEDWGDAGAAAGWDNYFSDVQLIYSQANHFTMVNAPYCIEWLTKMNIEQNIKQTL
jgi:amino acid adenylation domain-containing protein